MFFSLTEFINIICIIINLNSSKKLTSEWSYWTMLYVSLVHIIQAQLDQGIYHVVTGKVLYSALLYRDFVFLSGDIFVFLATAYTLHQRRKFGERIYIERNSFLLLIGSIVATCLFLSFVTFGG